MLIKCTDTTVVDCRGLMLPPGQATDLDPTDPVIAEHLTAGRLTAVQPQPDPAPVSRTSRPKEQT